MHLEAQWKIIGVVTEVRELTSPKNESWRGYVCRVATFGLAAEIQLTEELFRRIVSGSYLEFHGRFQDMKGILKLVCESFKEAEPDNRKPVSKT